MSTFEERAAATAAALVAADRDLAFDVSIASAIYVASRSRTWRLRETADRVQGLRALVRALDRALADTPSTDENLPEEVSPVRPGDRTP